jgi:hypothetical protein
MKFSLWNRYQGWAEKLQLPLEEILRVHFAQKGPLRVNVTNVLWAYSLHVNVCSSFLNLQLGFYYFLSKEYKLKAAHEILVNVNRHRRKRLSFYVCVNRCQFYQHFASNFLYESVFQNFFVQKYFSKLFFNLQFGFVIFWWKNIGAKAACKMFLVK